LVDWYTEELGLDLRRREAPPLPIPLVGSPAFEEFQQEVKITPFQEALEELRPHAYLSGRMRWQLPGRAALSFVERKGSVVVINPVVDVSRGEVEDFFEETGWPRDPHYFDPTKGPSQNLECGLNTTSYVITEREGQ
ncbi:MAG TPA: phosphoadenosine phosphosulfate reductase family protein, partial [Candidatus Saccharimonadales bacterium]|nr:phosphoadenosine phosphosulfate reductase family protein [Candidatus Saccharimonadales bacterium]